MPRKASSKRQALKVKKGFEEHTGRSHAAQIVWKSIKKVSKCSLEYLKTLRNGKLRFIWLGNDLMLLLKLRYWKSNSKSWKYCKSETFWEVFSNTVKLSLKANRQALPWKLLEVMVCIWLWLKSKNTKVVNSANTPSSMAFNLFRPRFKWCKLKNQY